MNNGLKIYWRTWFILLVLTLVMYFLNSLELFKWSLVLLLITGMSAKAFLIAANFMHLKNEKLSLILIVAISIIFISVALFLGIASDGIFILENLDR